MSFMKRYKKFLPLLIILAGVALLMTFLHFKVARPARAKNGFVRSASPAPVLIHKIVTDKALVNVAGILKDSIYFGTRQPGQLVVADLQLQGHHVYNIPVTDSSRRVASTFRTVIEQEKFYTLATNVPALLIYDPARRQETVYGIDRSFGKGIVLPGGRLIMRSADSTLGNQVIRKIDPFTGFSQEDDNILPRLHDGGFATDGVIHYDATRQRIHYVHFYANKILVLDTNLHLLATHQTIDTFSQYQAKGRSQQKGRSTSYGFAQPPRLLNAHSQIDNGKLYVMSWLKADNETDRQFDQYAIIDVYDTGTGAYTTSIYVPREGRERVFHFYVSGNKLWTLYDNSAIAQYTITPLPDQAYR